MKNLKNSGIEWLGEIPEHWEMVKIKYIANYKKGKNPKKYSDIPNENIYLTMEFLRKKHKKILYIEDTSDLIKVSENDILLLWDGANAGEFVLAQDGYLASTMAVINFKDIEKKYAKHFLVLIEQELRKQTNGMGIPHVNGDFFENLFFAYPPLKEQEQIANFLDEKCEKIQNFIEKKEKLLSLLQEQKQALINETISKGLDKNVKLKNSGIEWLGEIPEHWEVRKLKMLFSFGNGLNITKADFISFGIPCISYGEIHSKYPCRLDLSVHKLPFVSETYLNDKPQSLLSKGDFVFADTSEDIEGSGNFTCIQSNIPLFAGYHTIILRPKTQIYSLYFSFLFDSIFVRNQIREKVWGVKVFSITKSILKEVQCFIPPLKEQEQIANFLDEKCEKIDSLITKIKKQIELIKEYKTTLINEAVCGRMNL
ncbi:restriction endonuclease subunit S [Campylobacter sp. RM9756]|uniref:restriction endonuclease subunit S n=1 Tax=Campylobacter molothri TaxID=1032242 RepID=UPI001D46CD37|nr:restriction endonuclease subunit S [Campylobacter sp. RM9756]